MHSWKAWEKNQILGGAAYVTTDNRDERTTRLFTPEAEVEK